MADKDPMLVALGEFLRARREKCGWSQEEMAFRCGLHRTYIGGYERGEYNLTVLTLRKITSALEISMVDAMKGMARQEKANNRRKD